jgi:hypothetical protein
MTLEDRCDHIIALIDDVLATTSAPQATRESMADEEERTHAREDR